MGVIATDHPLIVKLWKPVNPDVREQAVGQQPKVVRHHCRLFVRYWGRWVLGKKPQFSITKAAFGQMSSRQVTTLIRRRLGDYERKKFFRRRTKEGFRKTVTGRLHRLLPPRASPATLTGNDQRCPVLVNLDCYSSTHIRSRLNWHINSSRYSGRSRFGNYVQQNFTNFASTRSYRISFFILDGVYLSAFIQGKNHRSFVHQTILLRHRRSCPAGNSER